MTGWKLTFLGTAASAFSKRRNPTSMLLQIGGNHLILLDCPDGTTRRLIDTGIDVQDIATVMITHGHNDHLSGLTSLVWQNWLAAERCDPLEIVAPAYVHERFDTLMELFSTPPGVLPYPILRTVVDPSLEMVSRSFQVAFQGDPSISITFQHARGIHQPESHAYRVDVARGSDRFSLCYSGDTAPCHAITTLASGCDVLIHEATFLDVDVEKATTYNHSTPSGAAHVASTAGVRDLVLVHYSNTLEGRENELRDEAAAGFAGKVVVGTDGMVMTGNT